MAKARRTDGISFRSFTSAWCSSITGKYAPLRDEGGNIIKGKENEAAAKRAYYLAAIKAGETPKGQSAPTPTVGELANDYLVFLRKNRAPSSHANAKETLVLFLRFVGDTRKATEIGRHELRNFIASKTTWGTHRQGAGIAHVVAAFNYGIETGKLVGNQFGKFKKPANQSRVVLLSQEQEAEIIKAIGAKPFADYWQFLLLSGARPDEGARVEAKNLVETANGLQVVLHEHKAARKTGKVRVIYLNPEAATIARKWAAINPQGPIFTRKGGKSWSDKARVSQWERIRNKIQAAKGEDFLNDEYTLYACRHTFATRKLAQGIPVAVVATLCGNTPRMIEQVYGHLNLCGNMLWAAVQGTFTVAQQAPTVQAAT